MTAEINANSNILIINAPGIPSESNNYKHAEKYQKIPRFKILKHITIFNRNSLRYQCFGIR